MTKPIINWRAVAKGIVAGVVVYCAGVLIDFDPLEIDEWSTWAIDIGGGLARSIGAAVLAVVWATSGGEPE